MLPGLRLAAIRTGPRSARWDGCSASAPPSRDREPKFIQERSVADPSPSASRLPVSIETRATRLPVGSISTATSRFTLFGR